MRAICIDSSNPVPWIECHLVEGEVYNIDPSRRCPNKCCVYVEELRQYWGEERFVPLPDADETELVEEKELVVS